MLKKFRIPTLGLVAAMVVAVPNLTFAADRDNHRGRDFERREVYRGHDRAFREHVERGFRDRFGVWHPYGC